ncbi:MAG: winged helix-turn-helix domain-containing protein [Solirubrobacteraceae bacterium]
MGGYDYWLGCGSLGRTDAPGKGRAAERPDTPRDADEIRKACRCLRRARRLTFQALSYWTFLTDHAHILVLLSRDPRTEPEMLADELGVDLDIVEPILDDLEEGGYIRRERKGGKLYTYIDRDKPLRHSVEKHHPVGRLIDAVESPADLLRSRLTGMD